MGKKTMVIEVQLDLKPAENQIRAFAAANNMMKVSPVPSPVGATVPALSGVPAGSVAGLATSPQAALAAAMQQAQAAAAPYASAFAQGAMPLGASSPNFSYLLAQRGSVGNVPVASPVIGGASSRGGGFSFLGFRAAIPIYAALQAARWASSMQENDLAVRMAGSDTEAFSTRAEHVLGDGIFGSLFTEGFNIAGQFGFGNSPNALRTMAAVESRRRGVLDESQSALYTRQYGNRLRSAEKGGTDYDVSRARAENAFEKAYRSAEAAEREARSHLGGQPFRLLGFQTNWWDYKEPDAGARASYQTAANSAVADKNAALLDRNADMSRIGRAEDVESRDLDDAVEVARMMANRASNRSIERFELDRRFRRRLGSTRPGDVNAQNAIAAERFYTVAAQEGEWLDADRRDVAGFTLGAQIANLRAAGNFSMAQSLGILQRAGAQVSAHWGHGLSLEMLQGIGSEALAQLGEVGVAQARQRGAFTRSLNVMTSTTTAALNRDPLGMSLAQIEGARAEALADGNIIASANPDAARRQINENYDRQRAIAIRAVGNRRSDTARVLGGEIERAELGLSGGPTRFLRQSISSILQTADLDVRHLEDESDFTNAGRRRDLTRLQLRGVESDFYRSIDYREASPRGVYGTGTLGGIRKDIGEAMGQVDNLGRGGGAGSGVSWTPDDVRKALDGINKIAMALVNGIASTAG